MGFRQSTGQLAGDFKFESIIYLYISINRKTVRVQISALFDDFDLAIIVNK